MSCADLLAACSLHLVCWFPKAAVEVLKAMVKDGGDTRAMKLMTSLINKVTVHAIFALTMEESSMQSNAAMVVAQSGLPADR